MKTRVLTMSLVVSMLVCVAVPALAAGIYRMHFLAADVEPDVYVSSEVFFLKPWGSNAPSLAYVELSTWSGAKYCGRLVKISEYEIALSKGYETRRNGQKVEDQIVVPKKNVILAKIYW
jgi:hypothetical protein